MKPLLDTSVDLATSVEHHQPWFLNSSNVVIKEKDITTSMKDLVRQVSFLVQERKDKNIPPGSDDDPIIQLFRYVRWRKAARKELVACQ